MKLLSLQVIASYLFSSVIAWVPIQQGRIDTSLSKFNLRSRGSDKWEEKKGWLNKRGIDSMTSGLAMSESESNSDVCTVIGGGRIGSMLMEGGETLLLKRGDKIPEEGEGTPILIATRNDSLDGIIESCPENRKKDLVFMQNGYLDDFLESKGLLENTQVLLFVSVTAMGAEPVDGITSVNPEGLTAASGIHAEAFKNRMTSLNLKCNVISSDDYKPAMFEKLMYVDFHKCNL